MIGYLLCVPFDDFRQRALSEGLRYKEDRMVFLRELAQNSRDAGARRIGVSAMLEGDDVVIALSDDGRGMTFEHARAFLFTLYASSKDEEQRAAGRFGVGFWSVLLFEPDRLLIESRTDDGESWAMALDGALQEHGRVGCGLATPGTRITLRKHVALGQGQRILLEVERALLKYCRYLRKNDRKTSVLPVYLNGTRVDKPFAVGGPCWMAFREGAVEGAVGLGQRPQVELYARGILVWRGTTIDELRHGATPVREPSFPEGLAPVYILCGNDLSVTMDRRAVIDDRALSRVRLAARRRMRELLGLYLDGLGQRPLHRRLAGWIAGRLSDLRAEPRPGPWIALAVLLAILATLGFLPLLIASGRPAATADEAAGAPMISDASLAASPLTSRPVPLGPAPGFDGPLVHPSGPESMTFIRYSPPDEPVLLRVLAAEEFHPGRGPRAPAPRPASIAPPFRCAAGCTSIEAVAEAGAGPLHLPTPTGHRVDTGSVWLAGRPVENVHQSAEGQALIVLTAPVRGALFYRTGPSMEHLEPKRLASLLALPGEVRLPADLVAVVEAARSLPSIEDRVELLRSFAERRLSYDRGEQTAEAYSRYVAANPASGWIEFVLDIGRGDCDVKNGLLMLLARQAGVSSRLAIGYAGRDGGALPGMHAWVEYHDRGWLSADATGTAARIAMPTQLALVQRTEPTTDIPSFSFVPFEPLAPGEVSRPSWLVPVIIAAGSVALVSSILVLFLLLGGRVSRKLVAPGGGDTRRRVAAEMIAGVLALREVWSGAASLDSRPLLPVLGERAPMSLAEAREYGRNRRLWYSAGRHTLVRNMIAGKARILDAADPVFGHLASRIPGAIDLDDIARLTPLDAERLPAADQPAGRLIQDVDELVAAAGVPLGTVVPCLGLEGALCRDIDLSGLPLAGTLLARRFVAVGVTHPDVRRRVALAAADGWLAAFLLLDLILAGSGLLRPDSHEIRRRAAARSLELRS